VTTVDVSILPVPEAPYRGLEPYRFCDQAIFFERETDAERLIRQVTMYRASLLYGESGAGKSSLINAGLIPKAMALSTRVERLRVQPSPGQEFVVERIARSASDDFIPSLLMRPDAGRHTTFSIEEFTGRIRDVNGVPLLLIFDQFEELLTLTMEAAAPDGIDTQSRILEAIVGLITDRKQTNLRFLFVFREDYLAKFDRLFYFCPELTDRFLRLTPPPASALRRLLRGPFESDRIPSDAWSRQIPDSVLTTLESQLRPREEGAAISLSQVQIAALQVWRSSDPEGVVTRRGADGLVDDYLQGQLERFRDQQPVAESLLSSMITRQGTRKVVAESELVDELEREDHVPAERTRGALEKLVSDTRLVRRDYHRGTTTYEIVSEFLVPWIRPLKLRRAARKARNLWLKRAIGSVVAIGAVLIAVFSWKYSKTTEAARRDELVMEAEARAGEAISGERQALDANKALTQRVRELEGRLAAQPGEREKVLSEQLSSKGEELDRQQAAYRALEQTVQASARTLTAEREARAADQTQASTRVKQLEGEIAALALKLRQAEDSSKQPAPAAEPRKSMEEVKPQPSERSKAFQDTYTVYPGHLNELKNISREGVYTHVEAREGKKGADGARSESKALAVVVVPSSRATFEKGRLDFDKSLKALMKDFLNRPSSEEDLDALKRSVSEELERRAIGVEDFNANVVHDTTGGPVIFTCAVTFRAARQSFEVLIDQLDRNVHRGILYSLTPKN